MKKDNQHIVKSQIKYLYSMKPKDKPVIKSGQIQLHRNDDGSYDIPDNIIFSTMLIFVDGKPVIEKMTYIKNDNGVIIPGTKPDSKVYIVVPL